MIDSIATSPPLEETKLSHHITSRIHDRNQFETLSKFYELTHTQKRGATTWTHFDRHNYSQMGIDDSYAVGGGKIAAALAAEDPRNEEMAMINLATAEAARSQVVYQIIVRMLYDPRKKLPWSEFKPILIGSWIFNTTENHKTKPIQYGALGAADYYNAKAKNAIASIRTLGFQLD
ncbi:hypothetical protein NHH03_23345 [Stieleria sp. TO1_6]|uniref:hypothetical protein n=1 Tax=Stieleria tagensis TaxID=2956795 RepID=UPI00209B2324|nr:hypothetical protein [Stieleria tagensis]MCO8124694.1 hypothetical protein [Stieleria tagensis]